jgi:hypothetical protein
MKTFDCSRWVRAVAVVECSAWRLDSTAVRDPDRVAQAEWAELSLHAEESTNLDEVARATGGEAI